MLYVIVTAFIVLDVISGILKAAYHKSISSSIMRNGLVHKFGYAIILALSQLIDYSVAYVNLPYETNLFPAVVAFICLIEIVSIVENVSQVLPSDVSDRVKEIFRVGDKNDTETS